jgi:hypothetical protein
LFSSLFAAVGDSPISTRTGTALAPLSVTFMTRWPHRKIYLTPTVHLTERC